MDFPFFPKPKKYFLKFCEKKQTRAEDRAKIWRRFQFQHPFGQIRSQKWCPKWGGTFLAQGSSLTLKEATPPYRAPKLPQNVSDPHVGGNQIFPNWATYPKRTHFGPPFLTYVSRKIYRRKIRKIKIFIFLAFFCNFLRVPPYRVEKSR